MPAPSPTATLHGRSVKGTRHPSGADFPRAVDIFYGIPFARARRFQTPETLGAADLGEFCDRDGGLDASRPGSVQPSAESSGTFAGSAHEYGEEENPLRLNVFRAGDGLGKPAEAEGAHGTKGSGWPVVMYVHGGAFNFGDAMERDLVSFVSWARGPMVAVSAAYRLGALGFPLDGDDEEEERRAVNLGLRDQRAALEWVREWISAFGGDPASITMMGCSAGAHSIGHLMLAPERPPFRKAILESGAPTARAVLAASHPRTTSHWHELRLRILASSAPSRSAAMSRIPVDALVCASGAVFAAHVPPATWPFQPVVDGPGGLIPTLPLRLWSSPSSSSSLPGILTGFCSHEGNTMVPRSASFAAFFSTLIPALTPADIAALEELYPASPYRQPDGAESGPFGAQFRRISAAFADWAYICPVLYTAHAASLRAAGAGSGKDPGGGHDDGGSAPVYLYEYAALGAPYRAASHGDHAPAVAHGMAALRAVGAGPGLRAVSAAMHSRWTAFIASRDGRLPGWHGGGDGGTRTGDSEIGWPPFKSPLDAGGRDVSGPGVGELLVFGARNDEAAGGAEPGTPVGVRRLTEGEVRRCRFWWARMELSQGMGERGVARAFTGDVERTKMMNDE